ncbi:MAG: ATP-binding cassette protein [Euryarchaeota archaeon]|nr:ATP-binding cassette protein [Euryarchaeota archaeon]
MKAIEVKDLTKYYGRFCAVDHITFEVEKGEFFGFLGPNGAGKTTTIQMLTGLSEPSEGTASIMGYNISRDPFHAKEHFGVVPEVSNIYEDLTAWDNLMFAGELYGMPKSARSRRALELLDVFELTEFKNKKVKGFSKGMRRKLTLSMAIIHSPDILFLDEPTSGLDVQSSIKLKEILSDLNRDGTTLFLTTHTLEEANTLCDRVGIIVKGKLAVVDAPEKLKRTIQATQSVEFSFDTITPMLISDLASLPAVSSVRKEGDKFRLYTDDPSLVATSLFEYAKVHALKIISINTLGPSLEDAFLAIINRQEGKVWEP